MISNDAVSCKQCLPNYGIKFQTNKFICVENTIEKCRVIEVHSQFNAHTEISCQLCDNHYELRDRKCMLKNCGTFSSDKNQYGHYCSECKTNYDFVTAQHEFCYSKLQLPENCLELGGSGHLRYQCVKCKPEFALVFSSDKNSTTC